MEEKSALREGSNAREWCPGEIREISWREYRERKLCNDAEFEGASAIFLHKCVNITINMNYGENGVRVRNGARREGVNTHERRPG
jgi:hypothetical protein